MIGPYRLLREIGHGGMASVWLADRPDGLLERQVALKLPHVSWGIASFAERMARERKILASLTHPNIARLYDAGIAADGRPFLALEYVDGQPINAYTPLRHAAVGARPRQLSVQVARAVAYAHAHLVVHRDLKPSNILIDVQGQAHLLDFGIARRSSWTRSSAMWPIKARELTPHQRAGR
jgi:serine/threonine-protein kinase